MDIKNIINNLIISLEKNDKEGIKNSIDYTIKYISNMLRKNFKINHVELNAVKNVDEVAFMFASPKDNSINYSVDLILDTKNKIIKKGKEIHIDNYYNYVTYAMYIIQSVAHELCHCKQDEENKNGFLNEQTYINSLCKAINYDKKIAYLEKSYEGEAYKYGIDIMEKLFKGTMTNKDYLKQYQNQLSMKELNFFSKNIMANWVKYYINRIPFLKRQTDNKFYDIYMYANNYIANVFDSKKRKAVFKECPLICIGIEENQSGIGRLKNPEELMYQYFTNKIRYKGKEYKLDSKENINSLMDAYIYLLIPQLNENNYNKLCIKYGHDKMKYFMKTLLVKIDNNLTIYKASYEYSLSRIKEIRKTDKNILENIDEKYAYNKYIASITYLNEYKKRIENLLGSQRRIK